MNKIDVHLISDFGCDSLVHVTNDLSKKFVTSANFSIHVWAFVDMIKLEKVFKDYLKEGNPFIIYNVFDKTIREKLKTLCIMHSTPSVPILSSVIRELFFSYQIRPDDGSDGNVACGLEKDYFDKVEAMDYVMSHDDGQNMWDLKNADIVLIGVSRTSKSPTSVYLSSQGYKVANIPFISEDTLPEIVKKKPQFVIIGLVIEQERLFNIRKNRLIAMNNSTISNYIEEESIFRELEDSKRVFKKYVWPVIDVTYKSVEEIAAQILTICKDKMKNLKEN